MCAPSRFTKTTGSVAAVAAAAANRRRKVEVVKVRATEASGRHETSAGAAGHCRRVVRGERADPSFAGRCSISFEPGRSEKPA